MNNNQFKLSEAIKSSLIELILNTLQEISINGKPINIVIDGATAIKLANRHGLYTLPHTPRRASDLDFFIYYPHARHGLSQMTSLSRRLKQELAECEGISIENTTQVDTGAVCRFFLDKEASQEELGKFYKDWKIEGKIELPDGSCKRKLQVDILADNVLLLEPVLLFDSIDNNTNRIMVKNPLEALAFKLARFISGAKSSRQDIIDIYYLANGFNKNENKPLLNDNNYMSVRLAAIIYLGIMDCVYDGRLQLDMFEPSEENVGQLIVDLKNKLPTPGTVLMPKAAANLLTCAGKVMSKIFPDNKFSQAEIKFLEFIANPPVRDAGKIIEILKDEYQAVFNRYPNLPKNIINHPAIQNSLALNQDSLSI